MLLLFRLDVSHLVLAAVYRLLRHKQTCRCHNGGMEARRIRLVVSLLAIPKGFEVVSVIVSGLHPFLDHLFKTSLGQKRWPGALPPSHLRPRAHRQPGGPPT